MEGVLNTVKEKTISTHDLLRIFPEEQFAREHLERVRWGGEPECPECKSRSIYTRTGKRTGMYDCRDCRKHFSVCSGTVFQKSHMPLHQWIYAIYLLMTAKKGISSLQLSKKLGCTQKSAWFMLHRLRLACGSDMEALRGVVDIGETSIKDKAKNQQGHKQRGRSVASKQATMLQIRKTSAAK